MLRVAAMPLCAHLVNSRQSLAQAVSCYRWPGTCASCTTLADDVADLRLHSERTVRQTVQTCAGKLSEAERRPGISRNTRYHRLGELGLR